VTCYKYWYEVAGMKVKKEFMCDLLSHFNLCGDKRKYDFLDLKSHKYKNNKQKEEYNCYARCETDCESVDMNFNPEDLFNLIGHENKEEAIYILIKGEIN
jgi:hypothetical protein